MTEFTAAEQLNDLRHAIGRSRRAVAAGAVIELDGLTDEVARIAEVARNASAAERTDVLAAMDGVLREIDGLAIDLQRQHDAGLARLASDAYRAEPGMG
jgi:hypothetical protein